MNVKFCDELVEELEHLNQWSGGRHEVSTFQNIELNRLTCRLGYTSRYIISLVQSYLEIPQHFPPKTVLFPLILKVFIPYVGHPLVYERSRSKTQQVISKL